jgi:hypothetical protein
MATAAAQARAKRVIIVFYQRSIRFSFLACLPLARQLVNGSCGPILGASVAFLPVFNVPVCR